MPPDHMTPSLTFNSPYMRKGAVKSTISGFEPVRDLISLNLYLSITWGNNTNYIRRIFLVLQDNVCEIRGNI